MSNHCLHDAPSATYEECFCGKCGEYGDMEKLFEKECPSSKLCHCKMSDTTPKFLESITEHPDVQRLIGQVVELQAEIERLKDALVEYGTHGRSSNTIMCERDKHSDYPCTCGFEQALKGE